MDRTTELKADYEQMAKLVEKFEKRQQLKVEGDWILIEKEGEQPVAYRQLEPYLLDPLLEAGWIATPVKIFRESS